MEHFEAGGISVENEVNGFSLKGGEEGDMGGGIALLGVDGGGELAFDGFGAILQLGCAVI